MKLALKAVLLAALGLTLVACEREYTVACDLGDQNGVGLETERQIEESLTYRAYERRSTEDEAAMCVEALALLAAARVATPTASPQPSSTPVTLGSPSANPSPSASAAASPTPAATVVATATPAPTQGGSAATQPPAATNAPTATPAPTPVPTATPSPTPNLPAIARPVVPSSGLAIHGRATNSSGAGVGNACVTVGPPIVCFTRTSTGSAANTGYYVINLADLAAPSGSTWDIYIVQTTCTQYYSGTFVVSGVVEKNAALSGPC